MRNLVAVCFLLLVAAAGFGADIGSPIPMPKMNDGCDCAVTGVCNCNQCDCIPLPAAEEEETVALLDYNDAQVVAIQTGQPMLTYVGDTFVVGRRVGRMRGVVQARRATLFGSARSRLVLSTPRAGVMYYTTDLPMGTSLPVVQSWLPPELKTLDPGRGVVQLSAPAVSAFPVFSTYSTGTVCVGGTCYSTQSPMFIRR
jgi:hypothetical protein